MSINEQVAKHFSDVFAGDNWTSVNLKQTLSDVSKEEATKKVFMLNTIAALVFHINYYVAAVLEVLRGGDLAASDKFSFDVPIINTEAEWEQLVSETLANADLFSQEIRKFDQNKLMADFADPKYGNYYANIVGIIEHTHYHLGQMFFIKKVIRQLKYAES